MSLLQPAEVSQSAAKVGIFGKPGSGKTLTAIMILIALAKRDGNKPIAMLDTEGGSDFVKDICDIEGVPLLVHKGRAFVDMRDVLAEAEAECSGLLIDSYSEPWKELNEALRESLGLRGRRLQFQHRDELYLMWGAWVRSMLESPLHCVLAGRLSNEWDEVTDDAGDIEHIRVGTKMRGEGDAGYEPHLLIEMDAIRDSLQRDKKTKSKRGLMVHSATVLKDRFRVLNGRSFPFRDVNEYKQGMYETTAKAFAGHFDKLASRGSSVLAGEGTRRTSASLFQPVSGESAFAERQRRVEVALGEINSAIDMFWPSANGTEDKRLRAIVRKMLFGVRSEAAIKALLPETLEAARAVVALFESSVTDPSQAVNVKDEAQVIALLQVCLDSRRDLVEATVI